MTPIDVHDPTLEFATLPEGWDEPLQRDQFVSREPCLELPKGGLAWAITWRFTVCLGIIFALRGLLAIVQYVHRYGVAR